MESPTLEYRLVSEKPFDTVVNDIQETASRHGFRTLHVHNVQQTLAEKGFEMGPYSIVEVCNAKYAHEILMKNKSVGMMLPCPIVVFEEGGASVISMMRPTAISDMMTGVDFASIPADVEAILKTIVDEAAV
jgi:uncharacterized protein (DUF302 family)